jgi:hypothetical protein
MTRSKSSVHCTSAGWDVEGAMIALTSEGEEEERCNITGGLSASWRRHSRHTLGVKGCRHFHTEI